MIVNNTKVTYCTNIHKGENWEEHFLEIKKHVPSIREKLLRNEESFCLGLRLSAKAAKELSDESKLLEFQNWLNQNNILILTMNGFPYGDFHLNTVKDHVHSPDWTTEDRVDYTCTLFDLLAKLKPIGNSAGISTSPLSYRHWYNSKEGRYEDMLNVCTQNILRVADYLYSICKEKGHVLHLDIEPEPDGVLETVAEFIEWYTDYLLPQGYKYFAKKYDLSKQKTEELLKKHIQLCYDICHVALGFEEQRIVIRNLRNNGIEIGKVQVSSALKIDFSNTNTTDRMRIRKILQQFDEPIYLHQVVSKGENGKLKRYRDLNEALVQIENENHREWRAHFHVPIFYTSLDLIDTTQKSILELLDIHRNASVSDLFEIETYTWEVLPKKMQSAIDASIERELKWLIFNM